MKGHVTSIYKRINMFQLSSMLFYPTDIHGGRIKVPFPFPISTLTSKVDGLIKYFLTEICTCTHTKVLCWSFNRNSNINQYKI